VCYSAVQGETVCGALCGAVCCSVVQYGAVSPEIFCVMQCVAVRFSVVQCAAVLPDVLGGSLPILHVWGSVVQCGVLCSNVWQCVAV